MPSDPIRWRDTDEGHRRMHAHEKQLARTADFMQVARHLGALDNEIEMRLAGFAPEPLHTPRPPRHVLVAASERIRELLDTAPLRLLPRRQVFQTWTSTNERLNAAMDQLFEQVRPSVEAFRDNRPTQYPAYPVRSMPGTIAVVKPEIIETSAQTRSRTQLNADKANKKRVSNIDVECAEMFNLLRSRGILKPTVQNMIDQSGKSREKPFDRKTVARRLPALLLTIRDA